jgi:hypothetical protein
MRAFGPTETARPSTAGGDGANASDGFKRPGLLGQLVALLSPRAAHDATEKAASAIQRHARALLARREVASRRTEWHIVQLFASAERRAVMLIQASWLHKVRRKRVDAATRIQSTVRACWDRRRIHKAGQLLADRQAQKDELKAQLMRECCAILQKQSRYVDVEGMPTPPKHLS